MGDSRIISRLEETEQLVVVGLGSNLGDRLATLEAAIRALRQAVPIRLGSTLYESAPVGGPAQDPFLNAAVAVAHEGSLGDLLGRLQDIERDLGRVRVEPWGPRTIDLDILWAGERVTCTSSLTVPHRELRKRRFALAPLIDLFPNARDPIDGTLYREILGQLEEQPLARIDGEKWWKRCLT